MMTRTVRLHTYENLPGLAEVGIVVLLVAYGALSASRLIRIALVVYLLTMCYVLIFIYVKERSCSHITNFIPAELDLARMYI
jgi:hypothetical protein